MRIYEPRVRPNLEWVLPVHESDHEYLWRLDGTARRASWRPMPVARLLVDDEGEPRAEADLPWLGGHVLVLREHAVKVLAPLLDRSGELLPLACPDADLWLFNVLTVVDALDEEKSELVRFDDGDILDVERYVFRPNLTEGLAVFKVPQLLRGPLFLGDEFVSVVKTAGLRGPEFIQLWP
ncbi:imm11 family protein [Bradyrhizobium murdochi]|uniref:imm11 family protein n=1 Tax=Bradyrhizobium murdochi TaxID=1038859 RepID=UPI00055756F9|nr:DUF1629 domain-containing protein [Bradyrhizobium murdochi]